VRKHLYRAAALAAPVILIGGLAASSAGASTVATPATTGATVSTLYTAGYQATGRDFRFAQADIQVPDKVAGLRAPMEYAALESGDSEAGVGIMSCALAHNIENSFSCTGSETWTAFAGTFNLTLNGPKFAFRPLAGVNQGDQVFVNVYYNVPGNTLQYVITTPGIGGTDPTPGHTYYLSGKAHGATFNEAVVLDDWTLTPVKSLGLIGHAINSFGNGRFTTARGNQGTFVGPWTTSAVDLTSNGLGAGSGTTIISPTALNSDGISFKGLGSDSFTVEHGGTAG
jgi:hypothetical protein